MTVLVCMHAYCVCVVLESVCVRAGGVQVLRLLLAVVHVRVSDVNVCTRLQHHTVCVDMCVSPSVCRRHSPSLSPRLTVTGRDPSNYLFLDHMQMAERCGEQRLAGAAWAPPLG